MALIEYVGIKPNGRIDTVAGTGVIWSRQGDIQEVPDLAVPLLLKHPDVWRLVEQARPDTNPITNPITNPAAAVTPADDDPGPYELQGDDGSIVDLGQMDDAALKAFVRATPGLDGIDLRLKGNKLRDAIMAAVRGV